MVDENDTTYFKFNVNSSFTIEFNEPVAARTIMFNSNDSEKYISCSEIKVITMTGTNDIDNYDATCYHVRGFFNCDDPIKCSAILGIQIIHESFIGNPDDNDPKYLLSEVALYD